MNSSGYQILPPVLMYSGPAFCERQSAKVATERPKLFATCSGDIILSRENLNTEGLPYTLLVLLRIEARLTARRFLIVPDPRIPITKSINRARADARACTACRIIHRPFACGCPLSNNRYLHSGISRQRSHGDHPQPKPWIFARFMHSTIPSINAPRSTAIWTLAQRRTSRPSRCKGSYKVDSRPRRPESSLTNMTSRNS